MSRSSICFNHRRQIDCEQIRSRINQQLNAGSCSHEGLRQLHTKLYVFAHNQFVYIEERSNEPLRHYALITSGISFSVGQCSRGTPWGPTASKVITLMDPCQPQCLGRAHTQTITWTSNLITLWRTRWQWPAPYLTMLRRSARTF